MTPARVALDVVPDPEVAGCADVFVGLLVGADTVRAQLDTGAVRTSLAHPPTAGRHIGQRSVGGAVGTALAELWEVRDVALSSLRADTLVVDCGTGLPHGLVGLDLLGRGSWRLDVGAALLEIGAFETDWRSVHRGVNGHVLTDIVWPGVTARGLWDTGAGITVVHRAFAEAHPELLRPGGRAETIDSTGARFDLDLAVLAPYEIDGVRFAEHAVAVFDVPQEAGPFDLALGVPTIRQARWTVDLPNGRWCVDPTGDR